MQTFKDLYERLVSEAIRGNFEADPGLDFDPSQLDCLLHPQKHPLVMQTGICDCSGEGAAACVEKCPAEAIRKDGEGKIRIDGERCIGCALCIDECGSKKLVATTDIIPALKAVHSSKGPAYALIAPAFLGQFSEAVTPGKLRTALKKTGFDGMLEVALFADILTLKEALEFDKNIRTETDYQLTSCCCPMWIAMIRKVYKELMPHVPGSVSPMVACGRAVKLLHPDATTVFIGPCLAKKAEAREGDLIGAVDFVLTFQEVQNIFEALGIEPARMEESEKDHASRAGRIYARAGGVSEAVEKTLERLSPNRPISIRTKRADGVPGCRAMINELKEGRQLANFYEGMGCAGGCVGGPRSVTGVAEGAALVDAYGDKSPYQTPVENPYVVELLRRLGIDTVEQLLEDTDIFTRDFS